MTEVLTVDPERPDAAAIARAADCLRAGGLVAFPTETVYGLGVNALDRDAVAPSVHRQGRPANDPLIVHVTTTDAIAALVSLVPPDVARSPIAFWPGPLTVVLQRSPSSR
jgi:L-threonylcarbamoyladenylate synthase